MNTVGKLSSYGNGFFSIGNDAGESCNIVNVSRGHWTIVHFEAGDMTPIDKTFLYSKKEAVTFAKEYLKLDRNISARAGKALEATYAIIDGKN